MSASPTGCPKWQLTSVFFLTLIYLLAKTVNSFRTGSPALLANGAPFDDLLRRAHEYLASQHSIQYTTIQVKRSDFATHKTHL